MAVKTLTLPKLEAGDNHTSSVVAVSSIKKCLGEK